jgi:hypothetical protein
MIENQRVNLNPFSSFSIASWKTDPYQFRKTQLKDTVGGEKHGRQPRRLNALVDPNQWAGYSACQSHASWSPCDLLVHQPSSQGVYPRAIWRGYHQELIHHHVRYIRRLGCLQILSWSTGMLLIVHLRIPGLHVSMLSVCKREEVRTVSNSSWNSLLSLAGKEAINAERERRVV